ncbi:MAG: hypothetical protein V1790_17350 [Planctomycetota bacterium]
MKARCQYCGAWTPSVSVALMLEPGSTATLTLVWLAVCSMCWWRSVQPETRWQEAVMR